MGTVEYDGQPLEVFTTFDNSKESIQLGDDVTLSLPFQWDEKDGTFGSFKGKYGNVTLNRIYFDAYAYDGATKKYKYVRFLLVMDNPGLLKIK